MRTHTTIDSPMGTLTLVATDGVLSGTYMQDHRHMPDPATFGPKVISGFEEATEQLTQYFAGQRKTFTLRTHLTGSHFQRRIWQALTTIPYGHTVTYAELAAEIGSPEAVRAVGAANGANPIAVVVPCHRVIGADGNLTGFSGGLARKQFLLDLERPAPWRQGQLF
ncbi:MULTISPECIES: methylated-DNA--[protein]-cysteine S-methyltransferase [Streptosporangium]|uniref:Methylated-DNA--protein-cysteine methyltransferase n=1 Tax=Streptosporangium brasiliense TaxID=47480 RepID=A0ABT9RHP4_9ACTN|nr:methylated-DNA--[protein]-cysteine S-methyltransferase [Streptosporangium brasiliense]MDP9868387.1 methylated-DNA-[protein]-cysteine S-methyltransferase [Streptosporangium brasiliense]